MKNNFCNPNIRPYDKNLDIVSNAVSTLITKLVQTFLWIVNSKLQSNENGELSDFFLKYVIQVLDQVYSVGVAADYLSLL